MILLPSWPYFRCAVFNRVKRSHQIQFPTLIVFDRNNKLLQGCSRSASWQGAILHLNIRHKGPNVVINTYDAIWMLWLFMSARYLIAYETLFARNHLHAPDTLHVFFPTR